MKKRPSKPNVYDYQKLNVYLADLIFWYKTQGQSLRNLSKKLNISPTLLSLITNAKRQLTEENIDIWAAVIGWDAQEVSWLKQIIILEHAKPKDKAKALENLSRFNVYKENSSKEILTYKYLKKWWNVAIREMSALPGFTENEEWIQERLLFEVSLIEIRKSLIFLNKHGLLAKHGNFRPIDCQGDVYKLSLSTFHNQLLNKAVESIYKLSSEERYILGHTMGIEAAKFPEAKLILDEALARLKSLNSESSNPDEVYYFSVLGFPLTREKTV